MAYNKTCSQFLQYFMHQRIVSEEDAKKINNALFPGKSLENTIELINIKIAPLEFKINKVICEQDGDVNYVFIATFTDDFNCKPDPNKKILINLVNYIFESDGFVPYNQLRNIPNCDISDKLLDSYFTNKYLIADHNKNIYVSSMAISELETYLVNKFDKKRCMCCMSIVGHGFKCQSCEQFAHGHCLASYFKKLKQKKCPKCSHSMMVDWIPLETVNEV